MFKKGVKITAYINRRGQVKLNPYEQESLYKLEVHTGRNYHNDGSPVMKNGKHQNLTKDQIIWRRGWLACRKGSQMAYASKHKKGR